MTFRSNLYAPAMPDWLKRLPSNSSLNGRDVAALFKFSDVGTAGRLAHKGAFPAPDWRSIKNLQWRADTIRIEIHRRLAVSAQKT